MSEFRERLAAAQNNFDDDVELAAFIIRLGRVYGDELPTGCVMYGRENVRLYHSGEDGDEWVCADDLIEHLIKEGVLGKGSLFTYMPEHLRW